MAPVLALDSPLFLIEGILDTYQYNPSSQALMGATRPLRGTSVLRQQEVVIKYAPREQDRRLLDKECTAYERIQQAGGHSSILAPLEIIMQGQSPEYLILPFMEGKDLFDILQGPLSVRESGIIIEELSKALHFVHKVGIVHRDISLYNIHLSEIEEPNEAIRVTLYDFNNSSIFDGVPLSTEHENVGSPEYTAPEIWGGSHFDHRADMYAMGVVAYAMLTGACPFHSDEEQLLALVEDLKWQHLYNPIPSARAQNPALSDDVDWFFERALAKIPQERFQTALEFNAEFQKLL